MGIAGKGFFEDEDKTDVDNQARIRAIQELAEVPGENLISKFQSDVLP